MPTAAAPVPPLASLFERERIHALVEAFSEVVGLGAAIFDRRGQVFVSARFRTSSRSFHGPSGADPSPCDACEALPPPISGGQARVYRCRQALTIARVPLVVDGVAVGDLFVGSFLSEPADLGLARQRAQELGDGAEEQLALIGNPARRGRCPAR